MSRRTTLILAGLLASGAAMAQDGSGSSTGSTSSASLLATDLPPVESLAVAGTAIVGAAVGLSSDSDSEGSSSTSTSTSTATATTAP